MSYTIVSGTKFLYYNFIMMFYILLNSFINIYDDVILSFYIKSTDTFMDIDRETYKNLKKNRFIKFIDFLIYDNVNTLSIDNENILYTVSGIKNDEDLEEDDEEEDDEDNVQDLEEEEEQEDEEDDVDDEDDEDDEDVEDVDNEDEEDVEDVDNEDEEDVDNEDEEDKNIMFEFEDDIDYSYKKNKKQKIN